MPTSSITDRFVLDDKGAERLLEIIENSKTHPVIIPLRRRRQSGKLGSSVPRAEQHQKAACLSASASLHLRQGLAVIDGAGSLDEIARMSQAFKAAAFLPGMVLL